VVGTRTAVGLAIALALVLPHTPAGGARTAAAIPVATDAQFEAAVAALRDSGGTILLRPGRYGDLVVPARSSRPLRILGSRGARVEQILLDHARNVAIGQLTISPLRNDAWIDLEGVQRVDLHDLVVTAFGTGRTASVIVHEALDVAIRRSTFMHCGDHSTEWANCVLLGKDARHVTIEDNWFHDCFGCDFVHGRFRTNLVIRRNRFERALACRIGRERCRHQDLVELFAGRWLRVENNRFGVYRRGGAQLYLTNDVDHVRIANNLFLGTDPRVPGYRARVGIIVGAKRTERLPYDVVIANNTILTGARRIDGYAGSIRMSSVYVNVPHRRRPLLVNNVIGLLRDRWPVCKVVRASIANVVVDGQTCSESDASGDAGLDSLGRPTEASTLLIDRGNRRLAAQRDIDGHARGAAPDIGAYEYRGAP
jgi:hypothetical protein